MELNLKLFNISQFTGKFLCVLLISAVPGFAVQAQSAFTVSNTNDSGAGSLRQAIIDAEANPGANIIDATGVSDTIKLLTGLPAITQDLRITGPGKSVLAISGKNLVRPFFVTGGTVEFSDFSVVNGYAKGNDGYNRGAGAGMGGAIYIDAGTVTISNVDFINNRTSGGNTGSGYFGTGDGPFSGTAGFQGANGSGSTNGTAGGDGGWGAGGGQGGTEPYERGYNGGNGGFGGGGGSGNQGNWTNGTLLFGYGGNGGEFAGNGSSNEDVRGGAGAGLGGALFVRSGSTAYLVNVHFEGNTANRGITTAEDAGNGQGKAGAIFIHSDAHVFFHSVTFSENTADDIGNSTNDNADLYGYFTYFTPGQPYVTVGEPENVTYSEATLTGTVNPSSQETSYYFEYDKEGGEEYAPIATETQSAGSGSVPVSVSTTITGLPDNRWVSFRLIAFNESSADTSEMNYFYIQPAPVPVVTLLTPDASFGTVAIINGTINPKGFETTYSVDYTTDEYWSTFESLADVFAGSGSNPVAFSATLSGLQPVTRYYFRVKAVNEYGPSVTLFDSLITAPFKRPEAEVTGVGTLTATTVYLNGDINTKGAATSFKFQYGTDASLTNPVETALQSVTNDNLPSPLANTPSGNSMYVAYANGYVEDNASLNPGSAFTMETWVYRTQSGNILRVEKGSQYNFVFNLHSDYMWFSSVSGTNDSGIGPNVTIPAGEWTHVAFTFDANQDIMHFYLNGEIIYTSEQSFNPITNHSGTMIPYMYRSSDRIDELRYWNRALSPTEIWNQYRTVLTGTESGLVMYLQFNENSVTQVTDASGNGNHLLIPSGNVTKGPGVKMNKATVSVSAPVTNLTGEKYFYRLIATTADGLDTSAISSFKYSAKLPGVAFWVRSDSGVVKNTEGTIVRWLDLSGNDAHLVQDSSARQPTLENNVLSGFPAVKFTGSQYMKTEKAVTSTSGITVLAVTKTPAATTRETIIEADGHVSLGYESDDLSVKWGNGTWTTGGPAGLADSSLPASGQFAIHVVTNNGSQSRYYHNGKSFPSSSNVFSPFSETVSVGKSFSLSNGDYLNGEIMELMILDRDITLSERLALEARLVSKYKIGVKGVVANPSIPQGETGNFVLGNTGATVNFTDGTETPGTLDATVSSNPNINGNLPIGIQNLATEKYWSIVTTGLSGFTYSITLDLTGITGITDFMSIKVVKREDEFATWADVTGSPFFATVTHDEPFITISGLTSFSEFAVGSGEENTLPVELSAFTGQISDGKVVLNWSTTTETNNYGWEVERTEVSPSTPLRDQKSEWETIGFVAGKGTTTESQSYSFSSPATAGSLKFRLKQIDVDGKTTYSQIVSIEGKPTVLALNQNYPNPFNPSTTIGFALPASGNVNLVVFDILGREVATLLNKEMESGFQSVVFDASTYAAGVYFYKLSFNGKVVTKKLTLLK